MNDPYTKTEELLREAGKLLSTASHLIESHPNKSAALVWASAYLMFLSRMRQWLSTKVTPSTPIEKAVCQIDSLASLLQNGDPEEMGRIAKSITQAFDNLLAELS